MRCTPEDRFWQGSGITGSTARGDPAELTELAVMLKARIHGVFGKRVSTQNLTRNLAPMTTAVSVPGSASSIT